MTGPGKAPLVWQWLVVFTWRALSRLRFFPVTLLLVILYAARHGVLSRRAALVYRVAQVSRATHDVARNLMLWLYRDADDTPGTLFNVCLRLPPEAADANLHDVFSALLVHPGVRSIGLYWDSESMDDDLPIWGRRQGGSAWDAVAAYDDLAPTDGTQFEEFCRTKPRRLALPVAAARDAQTLLKRQAGGGFAVCLNVPPELASLADAVVKARPDIWFFDLSYTALQTTGAANHQSISGQGYSLHERMALASAADAYVGSFDEKGCAAVISGRPAILFGGSNAGRFEIAVRGDTAVWLPGPIQPTEATNAALQLLSRHCKQLRGAPVSHSIL